MKFFRKTPILMAFALTTSFWAWGQQLPPGTAQLGDIWSNAPVVTQEVDSVFQTWTNRNSVSFRANATNFWIGGNTLQELLDNNTDTTFIEFQNNNQNLNLGQNSEAGSKSIALGMPATYWWQEGDFSYSLAGNGTNYYWRSDYLGPVKAARESVAVGDSAQARYPVAVAIGDQAIVGALHTDYSNYYPVVLKKMTVTKEVSGDTTSYTTNIYVNAITNWYDAGQYERLPEVDAGWTKIESGETVDVYEQKTSGALRDISYLTPDEWNYYNRGFYGGQGTVPLYQAYYGVAIGSRAYVFGYHGVALGHYAHVSRPWAMAIGSEAHVYSEGAQGIGYDVDIATNAPYSLAVGYAGTIKSSMTNAIVIGVPDASRRNSSNYVSDRPTAVKPNSINIVYHGEGIKDFYIDGKSLQDRLSSEVKVVGNTKNGTKPNVVDQTIREIGNIPDNEEPLVFYSGDGGIYFFTKGYEDDSERLFGDISKIFINGKPLSEIIEGSSSHDADFAAYKTSVSNAAERAIIEVNAASNMTDVKSALTNFFNTIKQ